MPRKLVDEREYIALLNAQLKKSDRYKKGMEFHGVPVGASTFSGYDWKPADPGLIGIFAEVVHQVDRNYQVVTNSERIPADSIDHFLQTNIPDCPFCKTGAYVPVSYQEYVPEWTTPPRNAEMLAGVTIVKMAENDPWGEAFIPDFYAVPAVCDNCGNVQFFSLAHVESFLNKVHNE